MKKKIFIILLCAVFALSIGVYAYTSLNIEITPLEPDDEYLADNISAEIGPAKIAENTIPAMPEGFLTPAEPGEDIELDIEITTIGQMLQERLKDAEDDPSAIVAPYLSLTKCSDEEVKACGKDDDCVLSEFTDLDINLWWHDGIHFCVGNGLMLGTGDNVFNPGGTTTRGMVVTLLFRLSGESELYHDDTVITDDNRLYDRSEARESILELWKNASDYTDEVWQEIGIEKEEALRSISQMWFILFGGDQDNLVAFPDVPLDQWYSEGCYWAAADGLVYGYDSGMFGPDDVITREQFATVLYRYAQYYDIDVSAKGDLSAFGDSDKISNFAVDAMKWACGVGIFIGDNYGNLNPGGTTTRAEAATILYRFCTNVLLASGTR